MQYEELNSESRPIGEDRELEKETDMTLQQVKEIEEIYDIVNSELYDRSPVNSEGNLISFELDVVEKAYNITTEALENFGETEGSYNFSPDAIKTFYRTHELEEQDGGFLSALINESLGEEFCFEDFLEKGLGFKNEKSIYINGDAGLTVGAYNKGFIEVFGDLERGIGLHMKDGEVVFHGDAILEEPESDKARIYQEVDGDLVQVYPFEAENRIDSFLNKVSEKVLEVSEKNSWAGWFTGKFLAGLDPVNMEINPEEKKELNLPDSQEWKAQTHLGKKKIHANQFENDDNFSSMAPFNYLADKFVIFPIRGAASYLMYTVSWKTLPAVYLPLSVLDSVNSYLKDYKPEEKSLEDFE